MRKSNFEVLRLLCIFGIVFMHAMGNIDTGLSTWNTEWHIFTNALFNTGVTCFILISGYFGIEFRLVKLIEMDFMAILYTVLGVAARGNFDTKELLRACLPVITRRYWFITCYFALCFIAPLLNEFVKKVKKQIFEKLLVTLLVLFSVIPTITTYDIMQDAGKGLVDFVMIYLIGRYLALYEMKSHQKKRLCEGSILCILAIFVLDSILTQINGTLYSTFARDCSIFIIMAAVGIFLLFKEMEFSNGLVNRIAGNVLAVTVLDEHIQYFLKPYTRLETYGDSRMLVVLVAGYTTLVVVIAVSINEVRKVTVGKIGHRCAIFLAKRCDAILPIIIRKLKKIENWFFEDI